MNSQAHVNMADLVAILDEFMSIIKDVKGQDHADELEEQFYDALGNLISQIAALQFEEPDVLH